MDIITKRSKQQKEIMSIIDNVDLTNDPSSDFTKVKNEMLKQDLRDDECLTFAKHYFSEVMFNSNQKVEK